MRKAVKLFLPLCALGLFVLSMSGCGKSNIFSWARSAGSGSSIDSVMSDGYAALSEKNYAKALEYYGKVLDADPNNSEAIYGWSAAKLGDSGLDVASIISNMVRQQGSSVIHLSPALYSVAKEAQSSSNNLLPETIVANITKYKDAINEVLAVNKLPKIINATANGKISFDNPDVNINASFCLILRAAMTLNDYVEISDDYGTSTITTTVPQSVAEDALKDIASAYNLFLRAMAKLNYSDDTSIGQMKKDVKKLFDNLKSDLNITNIDIGTIYL